MGDCHLGGWRQPELAELNFKSFQHVIAQAIKEKVDFVLVAGDLFDAAYPPIETIKDAFQEFRKLREANIPVFMIAGSHDYSVSGKTFLDVLEKAGFAKNVHQEEIRNGVRILQPTIYKSVAIYGYPGKKSGLEVQELEGVKISDAPGLFRILMLHTAIRDAVGTLPIPAVDESKLPNCDYLALAHLHVTYNKRGRVYCGPTFPNNALELEELKGGSYYIVDTSGKTERKEIKLKDVLVLELEVQDALKGAELIISELGKQDIKDKLVILKLKGVITVGKTSDLDLTEVELAAKKLGAHALLKNTSKLHGLESEMHFQVSSENIEREVLERFQQEHPHKFNSLIMPLFNALQVDKKEDEKSQVFEERLMGDINKIIEI